VHCQTFQASRRHHPLTGTQVILLGNRGTQVHVTRLRPLCNGSRLGLKYVTYKLQVRYPSITPSRHLQVIRTVDIRYNIYHSDQSESLRSDLTRTTATYSVLLVRVLSHYLWQKQFCPYCALQPTKLLLTDLSRTV